MRITLLLSLIFLIASCKKDNTPPDLQFKTGANYTYANLTLGIGGSFTVGLIANKETDDLNLIYTEVAYDGTNSPNRIFHTYMNSSERKHAERNITITCRNQAGTERWVFNVNDADGRISKKEIKVTVQ